jgi:lipoprotein-anchoring transpeptidase ErfK/SrfK
MNRTQFLQEKSSFHIMHPERDDLAFYHSFAERHPDLSIGWFHLGQEWERRGQTEQALAAYRRAFHAKPDEFTEAARTGYHTLLRRRRKERWKRRRRTLLASLLLLYGQLHFSPGPLTDPLEHAGSVQQTLPLPSPKYRNHVEVVAVPDTISTDQLYAQLDQFLKTRRPSLKQPYTVIAVPEVPGVPMYTPLPFYKPHEVKGVLRYHPMTQSFLAQKWFSRPCACEQDPLVRSVKAALAEEQLALEQAVTLRNALYRYYQRMGRLPATLAELAGSYPANALPDIPQLVVNGKKQNWNYNPAAFHPERAWESLREVLPLHSFPEPSVPLQPLQVHIHQGTYSLSLTSGSHLVRQYPIGIGKNGLTPEGYFTVLQKINRPHGPGNIYGTRGLIFAGDRYAIHGTNNPASIGNASSLGCIRLHNAHVEELYTFVSPGTEVIISDQPVPTRNWSNPAAFSLPAGRDEETPGVIHHWLH